MNVWVRNSLRQQGMTEFFFESAEPSFDELSPARFFNRFRQGIYEIEGVDTRRRGIRRGGPAFRT